MTLSIELTPEEQATLESEAAARGLDLSELARLRLLDRALPAESSPRKRSAFGKYAGRGPSVDAFLSEKHAETAREEASWSKDHRAA